MGRRNVRTDDPVERIDTKILEVVFQLDDREGLVPGLRVVGYIEPQR
jgi:HlyD family secretion protein